MLFIPNKEVTKHETDLVEGKRLGNGKVHTEAVKLLVLVGNHEVEEEDTTGQSGSPEGL